MAKHLIVVLVFIGLFCSCFFYRNRHDLFPGAADGALTRELYCRQDNVDSIIIRYDNGQICKKTAYQGLRSYYLTYGRLKKQLDFENGFEQGTVLCWHKNGRLQDSTFFDNGRKTGIGKKWYDNGQLSDSGTYMYTTKSVFDDENFKQNSRSFRGWYRNGQIKDSLGLLNGICCGLKKDWYDNGQLQDSVYYLESSFMNGVILDSLAYENTKKGDETVWFTDITHENTLFEPGIKQGTVKSWYRNGRLKENIIYDQGREVIGSYTKWDSAGTCRSVWRKSNEPDRTSLVTWYPSGRQESSVQYYLNQRDSLATFWYPSGKARAQFYYLLGLRQTEKDVFWNEQDRPCRLLDRERIFAIIDNKKGELLTIYQGYFGYNRYLCGSLVATLTVAPNGRIVHIKIVSSSTRNLNFDREILDKLEGFDFGRNDRAENTVVTCRFSFMKRISTNAPLGNDRPEQGNN